MTLLRCDEITTPLGPLALLVSERGLCGLAFGAAITLARRPGLARRIAGRPLQHATDPDGFSRRAAAYFAGDPTAFDGAPLDLCGTPFQEQVWRAVRAIPAGATASYREIAQAVGRPRAIRAVGAANGANRVALAIPCHRIIGSSGSLTGYAFGLERKHWLLEHEQRRVGAKPTARAAAQGPIATAATGPAGAASAGSLA